GRGDLAVVFRCGDGVLLIFDPRKSRAAGREVPSHGAAGAGHIAFTSKPEDLGGWRKQLHEAGVSIEQEKDWEEGGRSIYFRDPAGNVVELAPPTLWGGGWEFEVNWEAFCYDFGDIYCVFINLSALQTAPSSISFKFVLI